LYALHISPTQAVCPVLSHPHCRYQYIVNRYLWLLGCWWVWYCHHTEWSWNGSRVLHCKHYCDMKIMSFVVWVVGGEEDAAAAVVMSAVMMLPGNCYWRESSVESESHPKTPVNHSNLISVFYLFCCLYYQMKQTTELHLLLISHMLFFIHGSQSSKLA
jgi:hypothetical protein